MMKGTNHCILSLPTRFSFFVLEIRAINGCTCIINFSVGSIAFPCKNTQCLATNLSIYHENEELFDLMIPQENIKIFTAEIRIWCKTWNTDPLIIRFFPPIIKIRGIKFESRLRLAWRSRVINVDRWVTEWLNTWAGRPPTPPPAGVTRGPGRHKAWGSSSWSFAICLALLRFRSFFSPSLSLSFSISLRSDVSDFFFVCGWLVMAPCLLRSVWPHVSCSS